MIAITPLEVQEKLMSNKTIHLIDVREVDEVKDGKIPQAIHIPLGLLEFRMHEWIKEIHNGLSFRGRKKWKSCAVAWGHGLKCKHGWQYE